MAEDLEDAEFCLPPQFLTDDDILMDFATSTGSDPDSSSGTGSDSVTETDDDEFLSDLTRQLTSSSITVPDLHSKGWVGSSSPKSTLCGYAGKVGSPSTAAEGATWDLLKKAAGEVERAKTRREKSVSSGTGFFDCSVTGQLRNRPSYTHPQFGSFSQIQPPKPGLVWGQVKAANTPLRLPPSAWPPLNPQTKNQVMGEQRECVGTGVFLPRQPPSLPDSRKKPSDGNGMAMKTRSKKGESQQRKSSKGGNKHSEFQLPQEWTY